MQLYLNNQLADMSDDTPVALTFQINNLAEVKNQQGNTSNQFKLPLTQRNRQILGFPDNVAFTSNLPYTRYEARLIQDGMEIVPYGFAELNSVDDNTASVTVLSGNVDFFDAIDGKLYDMGDKTTPWGASEPWKPFEHQYSLSNIASSQSKTEGWIWPIIDYGNLLYNADDQNTTIDIRYMRPGFFLKTAIDLMVKNAGFTATGSLLTDPLYDKLIVQFAGDKLQHGTDYVNYYSGVSLSTVLNIAQGYKHGVNGADESFRFAVASSTNAIYDTQVGAFVAATDMEVDVVLDFNIFYTSGSGDGSVKISIESYDPISNAFEELKSVTIHSSDVPASGQGRFGTYQLIFYNQKLICNKTLAAGQSIRVFYHIPAKQKQNVGFSLLPGARFDVTQKVETDILPGQRIQCERIFPDISQKDLLKDTLQRFGIICQTDSLRRIVNFASLRDIVANIPQARNWTSKCLDQGKNISFQLGNYAQINCLKYKQDDGITPTKFGNGQIEISDKTLPASTDLFESQFAPTLNRPYLSTSMAQIRNIDAAAGDNEFSISAEPRLLIDQKFNLQSAGKTLTLQYGAEHRVVLNDWISIPYFYKPDGEYNLCWGDMQATSGQNIPGLKTKYYPELERILTQSKKVVRWFMLSPRDILELDLLIPIYLQQDGAYYYINKIDSWRKGQATKVELVKLG